MKKLVAAKKALLGATLAGAIVIGGSYGTYSWFTSEVKATGEIINGTLQLNNGEDISTSIVSIDNFAPSQLVWGDWMTLENTGTMDAHLQATLHQQLDKQVSVDTYKLGYVAYKYKVQLDDETLEAAQLAFEELFDGTTNERTFSAPTVKEIAPGVEMIYGFVNVEEKQKTAGNIGEKTVLLGDGAESGHINEFWQLDSDEYIDLSFAIKLDEHAGNEYQGVTYNAELTVKAKHKDDGSEYN
ncbi:TasA family protein [Sutcliffiella halmapala]|uniref:TasA family protein n=1 Tax=Sutcliffiella halmapala TaxID=79882 RepID=UPI001474F2B5|nr:TasA family protein [Sutcliffiella halmapala]